MKRLGIVASVCALVPLSGAFAGASDRTIVCSAPAEGEAGAVTVKVSYADLDLTQAADRRILSRRIAVAAGQLCLKIVESRFMADRIICQQETLVGTRDQVRLAELRAQSTKPAQASARLN
jgi:UrcA family protein